MCTSADCVRKGLAVKNVTKFFSQWLGFPLSGSGGGALHEMCDSTHILLARVTQCVCYFYLSLFTETAIQVRQTPNFLSVCIYWYMHVF